MPPLDPEIRRPFEKSIVEARETAEKACRAALGALAVGADKPHASMTEEERDLRRALRAKQRQLGGDFEALVSDCAYEQWHRMLFARFLAENDLLMHPSGVPVTLAECAELAKEEGEGDEWTVAARFAEQMLPGIFRTEDPSHRLRLAPEGQRSLEKILEAIPQEVFAADDALGWVYQFWQTKAKKEVNEAERKIGGADLPPVTQLFTENYMVRFLLENSLGAWWAACHPESPLLQGYEYLRFTDEGAPAAGAFEGWPEGAAEVTVMDPCMGSGHFLVVAFEMLVGMRMEEEGLSEAEAGDAVIRDNLFGLELDPRCTQIGAFAIAFAAWKRGGYRPLPLPNVACSGIGVAGQIEEWRKLAKGDEKLVRTLERLHALFVDAPTLGSLIDPRKAAETGQLDAVDHAEVAPVLERALEDEGTDPAAAVFGGAAAGVARAADLLSGEYTLVVTNPPFLGRGKQGLVLRTFLEAHMSEGRQDLATALLLRSRRLARPGCTVALVSPEGWLLQVTYRALRELMLTNMVISLAALLGEEAFRSFGIRGPRVTLLVLHARAPADEEVTHALDVSAPPGSDQVLIPEKIEQLRSGELSSVPQALHKTRPTSRIVLQADFASAYLQDYCTSIEGLSTGDNPQYVRFFWELRGMAQEWERMQGAPKDHGSIGGLEAVVRWRGGAPKFANEPQGQMKGRRAWGKAGVLVGRMRSVRATHYLGGLYDKSCVVLVPARGVEPRTLWAYCSIPEFEEKLREIESGVSISTATVSQVPFDLEHWQNVAEERYPNGLPEPHSDDPTQWLFQGHPKRPERPLQVAVARLLGYRWPEQPEEDGLEGFTDPDGVVCLPAVRTEKPAAERIRSLLAPAYGEEFSPSLIDRLLEAEGAKKKDLDSWLGEEFFTSHCKLFHNRPFIWHIWDGRKDGFSALVNYHRLDKKMLERLTHTYLGWWITNQKAGVEREESGAEPRLKAALDLKEKLELIAEGDPPYDIYVRWKPLAEQPIGWDPDLNDGVRLNVRPFVEAGILRRKLTVHWRKDRGKDPDGSERINDLHHTRAEKLAAREKADG